MYHYKPSSPRGLSDLVCHVYGDGIGPSLAVQGGVRGPRLRVPVLVVAGEPGKDGVPDQVDYP